MKIIKGIKDLFNPYSNLTDGQIEAIRKLDREVHQQRQSTHKTMATHVHVQNCDCGYLLAMRDEEIGRSRVDAEYFIRDHPELYGNQRTE